MAERESADKDWPDELGMEEDAAPRVRVNDRRRINLDADAPAGGASEAGDDAPSLKPTYVEELEARTRAAEQKASDVQTRFEQVRAELKRETDELRQRLARTADERVAREKAAFIASLLPVIDNLRRAVEAAEGGGSQEALLDGLHGTISGFESVIAQAGAEPIEAEGQPFDPEIHEAVDTVEVEPEREGMVTAQYSHGYRLGGQLLRPARVQVGRSRGAAQSAGER
ncbi:MAG TPA: nucleotide exchange factor GrpE [Pyrinomonadaceae bacterium]|jgi:molecular chaperone GrpE|nr:nucleotide exchange factor GrpE [Pyrinomonadaceae bacterium]